MPICIKCIKIHFIHWRVELSLSFAIGISNNPHSSKKSRALDKENCSDLAACVWCEWHHRKLLVQLAVCRAKRGQSVRERGFLSELPMKWDADSMRKCTFCVFGALCKVLSASAGAPLADSSETCHSDYIEIFPAASDTILCTLFSVWYFQFYIVRMLTTYFVAMAEEHTRLPHFFASSEWINDVCS